MLFKGEFILVSVSSKRSRRSNMAKMTGESERYAFVISDIFSFIGEQRKRKYMPDKNEKSAVRKGIIPITSTGVEFINISFPSENARNKKQEKKITAQSTFANTKKELSSFSENPFLYKRMKSEKSASTTVNATYSMVG